MSAVLLTASLTAGAAAALAAAPLRRPMWDAATRTRSVPRPGRWLSVPLVLAAFAAGGAVGAVLAVAACTAWPRVRRRRADAHAAEHRRRAVVEALRGFALELGAGLSPAAAFAAAMPSSAAVRVEGARLGDDLGDEIGRLLTADDDPRLRELAACWTVSQATGAPMAALADRLVQVAEGHEAGRAEVRAALAAPRASGRLLAALPLGGVLLAASLGGSPVRFLLRTPAGAVCLLLATALDVAGLVWLERLARRVES